MTEVFVCRGGRWNILAFQETSSSPRNQTVSSPEASPSKERFVRDRGGRVSGIVYTMGDTEIEAKRVP